MAFVRPTLPELVVRIQNDFVSRLGLVGAILRRSMVFVMSRVWAGAIHMLYGFLEFLSRQLFPDLSEAEYLDRQAGLFIGARIAAGYAKATATATGSNGTLISAGTVLVRSDGVEYTTDSSATITAGTATLALTASLAGVSGSVTPGVVLSFESPIVGVNGTAAVATSVTDGSDQESDDAYRQRLREYFLNPPAAGTISDYIRWAKQVAGVTRVWPVANGLGPGTVLVRFVRDNDVGSIFPDAGEVAAVQSYLNSVAPVTAAVTVVAPTANTINFTLHLNPDTAPIRAAVEAELTDMLQRTAAPGSTTYLSQIDLAIANAAGLTSFVRTVPSADVTAGASQINVRGAMTYV